MQGIFTYVYDYSSEQRIQMFSQYNWALPNPPRHEHEYN